MEPDVSSCSYLADPTDRAHSLDDIILLADLAIWLADLVDYFSFPLIDSDLGALSLRTKFWCQYMPPILG